MTSTERKPKQFQAIKGVRDILPPESALWNRVEQIAREVFGTFGFAEIRLPIFEKTELFARSIGGETDVVGKEMYTFADHPLVEVEGIKQRIRHMEVQVHLPITTSSFDQEIAAFYRFIDSPAVMDEIPNDHENR